MKSLGDRRSRVRFEVVGTLRGSFTLPASARVMNMSADGALLHTSRAITVGTEQTIDVTVAGHTARVTGRITRTSRVANASEIYAVAIEFLPRSAAVAESLTQLLLDTER